MAAADGQICVAPLSSPYSLLPRAHTYSLVIALLLPLPRGWLFRAALAAFTTRTAVAAVDAVVLLVNLSSSSSSSTTSSAPAPLDIFVALEFLGLGVVIACWLLLASRRAGASAARPLIRAWAAAVTAGSAVAFAAVTRLGRLLAAGNLGPGPGPDPAAACRRSHHHDVLVGGAAVFGTPEDVAVLGSVASRVAWVARRVGIPAVVLSAVALLAIVLPQSAGLSGRRPDEERGSEEVVRDAAAGPWSQLGPARTVVGMALLVSLPAAAVFMAVSSEQYLHSMAPDLLEVEPISSVGQWGVWAATGVVVVATFVNAMREKMGLGRSTGSATGHLPAPGQDGAIKF